MSWRERLVFCGFCMAGGAVLLIMAEFGGWVRFGSVSDWVIEASLPGTLHQWLVLAYASVTVILLSVEE